MPLNVAVQMDPIERINIAADSTFRIMEEAQARGHRLFYYTPDRLALDEGRVTARGWPVEVRRVKGDHFTLGPEADDRPRRAGRGLAAPGSALRHGLHHHHPHPRPHPSARRWW